MNDYNNNSKKLIEFISVLKEAYSNTNLNIDSSNIHKNNRFDSDIELFRSVFEEGSYIEDNIVTESSNIAGFTLKNTNGLKVEFERRETEDYFDYEIVIVSPFDDFNINILDEIGLDININDQEYLKKFYDNMIEEQMYFSVYGNELNRFYLNSSEYLVADIDSGTLEIFYGNDHKEQEIRLESNKIPSFISNKYDLYSKISGKINKTLSIDLFKGPDYLADQLMKFRNSYDGEQVLRLINEKDIDNQKLINYAVEDMLDEYGFYSNIPERIDTALIEKDYYLNSVVMNDYKLMKDKIEKFDNDRITLAFRNATEIDKNNYNYDTSKSNIALIIDVLKGNSGLRFKEIIEDFCSKNSSELFRIYYERKEKQMMIINEDVSHERKWGFINDYFKQYVEVREGKLENFLYAPYYLNRCIIPEIQKMARNIKKMLENKYFRDRFSKDNGAQMTESIGKKCNHIISEEFEKKPISYPELVSFMEDGIKIALKVIEIKNDVIGTCNDLKFALMDLKEDSEEKIKSYEAEIKRIFFKKNKIPYYEKIDKLRTELTKQEADTDRQINDLKQIEKDYFFEQITPEYFRIFPNFYRQYMSLNFVETPIECLITRDHTGLDRFKLEYRKGKWCAVDSYSGSITSSNLIDYVSYAMNNDFDSIDDDGSQASVIKNYYEKASNCRDINELITLIKTEYDKNYGKKRDFQIEK